MPKKTKYAEAKEAGLKRVLGRIENPAKVRQSSSRNPPQLPSTLSWHERESREADAKLRDAKTHRKAMPVVRAKRNLRIVGCGRSLWAEQRAVDNRPATLPVRPFLAIKTDAGQGCSGLTESLVKTQCAFVRIKSR
jgi:hypothetical protein